MSYIELSDDILKTYISLKCNVDIPKRDITNQFEYLVDNIINGSDPEIVKKVIILFNKMENKITVKTFKSVERKLKKENKVILSRQECLDILLNIKSEANLSNYARINDVIAILNPMSNINIDQYATGSFICLRSDFIKLGDISTLIHSFEKETYINPSLMYNQYNEIIKQSNNKDMSRNNQGITNPPTNITFSTIHC